MNNHNPMRFIFAILFVTALLGRGIVASQAKTLSDIFVQSINETPGINVSPTSLTTQESATSDQFNIHLDTQPQADVLIGIASSDPTEGTVFPASVTFNPDNWGIDQTVTVTGVDDSILDGEQIYNVTVISQSVDPNYDNLVMNVSVTNQDNDTVDPAVIVDPLDGVLTSEQGTTDTFTLVLASLPMASVTIDLSSSDTTEGTVAPTSVTFSTADWYIPQTVTVTGVDDSLVDGAASFLILTSSTSSSDLEGYNGLTVDDIPVTNQDNDTAGIAISPTVLTTTEARNTVTSTVVLLSEPGGDVSFTLNSSDTTEGTVAPASLTFTPGNWSIPQEISITGEDDNEEDGDILYTIQTGNAVSTDPNYNIDPPDITVTNLDDERRPVASDDNYIGKEDKALTVSESGVLSNDAGYGLLLTAVLVDPPASGILVLNKDGSFKYTPDKDFNGMDSFIYQAFNGKVSSLPATVFITIEPVNDPPAGAVDTYILNRREFKVPAPGLLSNDINVDDGDTLGAVLESDAEIQGTLQLSHTGAFTYTPAIDNGTAWFTYLVTDTAGTHSDPVTVTLVVDSKPPTSTWTAPVGNGGIFDTKTCINILASIPEEDVEEPVLDIKYVYYLAWDAIHLEYDFLGAVFDSPYEIKIDACQLNPSWNQVSAIAVDEAGNSGISDIWIVNRWIYLPVLAR